jgi:hypothetical protein
MKAKYLRKVGIFALSALMLFGIVFAASSTAEAQGRRRVVIIRPYPYRYYRPFGFGYRNRWNDPFGYNRYDPWSPYGSYYRQYVFRDSEAAINQGYKDGFKTGKDDGKKSKSYKPERSHYFHDAGFGNFAEVYRGSFSRGYRDGYNDGNESRSGR